MSTEEQQRPLVTAGGGTDRASRNRTVAKCVFSTRAVLRLIALSVLAVTLAVVLSRDTNVDPDGLQKFGFNEAFNSSLAPKFSSVYWVNGKSAYTAVEPPVSGSVVMYTLTTGQSGKGNRTVLAAAADLIDPLTKEPLDYSSYVLSPDGDWILFQTAFEKVYRWSSTAIYHAFSIATKSFVTIGNMTNKVQDCQWASTGHGVHFVRANNLYLYNLETLATTTVTTDGLKNTIINGINDWVYEEEVLGTSTATWWSPDSQFVSFLRFGEARVKEYTFSVYQMPYNKEFTYKYPKAGAENSVVTMLIYNVATGITVPAMIPGGEAYFIEVTYFDAHTLVVRSMPRLQNTWTLYAINVTDGKASPLRTQTHDQYLEPSGMLTYLPQLNAFVDLIVVNNWNHLVLFDAVTGDAIRNLTSGAWQVDALLAVNRAKGILYYSSTAVTSIERAIYGVVLATGVSTYLLPREAKGQRTFQTASFSTTGEFFVLNEAGDMPSSSLRSTGDSGLSATLQATLEDNEKMRKSLLGYALPTQTYGQVDGNFAKMNSFQISPPGFTADCSKRYPVLINVYGGPGAQMIQAKATIGAGNGFHTFLSSTHNYIIFSVDAIGTGLRGDWYQKATTYQNLGVNEAKDVVKAVAYLKTLCYVDPDRIALWGWSYGGFLTSMVTGEGNSGLRSAIAVAPVADWGLYDSIYTERYMRTPAENPIGYNTSSVLSRISKFNDKTNYLLVHGTADDNVHFQNGAMIAKGLVENRYQFSTMFYPNRDHSLRGTKGETNLHLYKFLTDFLLRTMA